MTADAHEGEAYCPTCDKSYPSSEKVCPADGTRLVDLSRPADPMIGRTIDGRFTIRERLGAGGMGVVYRAWQASVGREVAIKVIAARPGDDSSTAKRFLREAKLASQLAQPNVVTVFDFGATEDGTLYLVMELLRGRTLGQVSRSEPRMSPRRVRRIAIQLLDALEAAHRAGIVHRDLKPANVMILDEPAGRDFVKVLDFGLAKALDTESASTLTQSDRVVGTPSYMAPEVITGAPAEPRSDLYSVGVMLYELLAGRLPYAAPNANVMLARHAYAPVPDLPPEVPAQVAHVVKRLLAKAPEQRYATAGELRDALEAAVSGTLAVEPPSDQALIETRDEATPSPAEAMALVSTVDSGLASPGSASGSTASSPGPSTGAEIDRARAPRRRLAVTIAAIVVAGAMGAGIAVMMRSGGGEETGTGTGSEPESGTGTGTGTGTGSEPETGTGTGTGTGSETEMGAAAPDAGIDAAAAPDAAPAAEPPSRRRPPRRDRPAPDAGVRASPPPDAPPPPRKIDAGLFVDPE